MLSLPNLLTLSRILAVPILVFLLWRPSPVDYAVTFVLYCVVGLTDYLDGYLARAQGLTSRLGQFLDGLVLLDQQRRLLLELFVDLLQLLLLLAQHLFGRAERLRLLLELQV